MHKGPHRYWYRTQREKSSATTVQAPRRSKAKSCWSTLHARRRSTTSWAGRVLFGLLLCFQRFEVGGVDPRSKTNSCTLRAQPRRPTAPLTNPCEVASLFLTHPSPATRGGRAQFWLPISHSSRPPYGHSAILVVCVRPLRFSLSPDEALPSSSRPRPLGTATSTAFRMDD